MSKLFKLKEWLTVDDAARHLSIVFNEEVTEADVLRLALDGRLRLSVYFVNHTIGKRMQLKPIEGGVRVPSLDGHGEVLLGHVWSDTDILECDTGQVVPLSGVWDLPMKGGEGIDVERRCQMLKGGPEVTLIDFYGAFVTDAEGGIYQLMEWRDSKDRSDMANRGKYLEAISIPEDSVLVVRTEALREFERHSNDAPLPTSRANASDKLAKMNQASMKFWGNADRDERGTHPDNATVAAWLVQQGFSPTLADKAATIIRPEWAPTGRKPEE